MTEQTTTRTWSIFQQAIFTFVQTMLTHLVIMARAGCGKTTTIVEATKYLPEQARILFCAFNVSIVEELKLRLPSYISCSTLHSIGFSLVRAAFRYVKVDESKGKLIAEDLLNEKGLLDGENDGELIGRLVKLTALAKNTMARDVHAIADLAIEFQLCEEEGKDFDSMDMGRLAFECCERAARAFIGHNNYAKAVDYDDMLFLCWRLSLNGPKYDYVIVDEVQDLNASRLWLARRMLAIGGKMIVVGDDRQAIYGFCGADADAMGRMTKELGTTAIGVTVLPLSETYRCPKAVVTVANTVVPDIRAHADAPEGLVAKASISMMIEGANIGDFVLSRKRAPLMGTCLRLLARGIPAVVTGRDIGGHLLALVRKSKVQTTAELLEWVESYRQNEAGRFKKLPEAKAEQKLQELDDTCECLVALTEGLTTIAEMRDRVESLFSDKNPANKVVLSTVHKAKGLERNRVWVLTDTFRATAGEGEEANLWYVAVTRAKAELHLVKKPIAA